jgi:HEPN domain-containing protein
MPNRYRDWLRQADRDLMHARHSLEAGDFEWACFASQQSAEKAVKGLAERFGIDAWGHSVSFILKMLPPEIMPNEGLIEKAKELDKLYIQPRYPNGFPIGAPADYYTEKDAKEAIENGEAIYNYCIHKASESC